MTYKKWHNNDMKSLFVYAIAVLLIFNSFSSKVYASENRTLLNESQIQIANKYAEKYCSAKADHFFEGLDNEKTLKYSYFRYIGLQREEIFAKKMYHPLINQIREMCSITKEEESEIYEFFIQADKWEMKSSDKFILT